MTPEQRRGVPGEVETVKVKADNEDGYMVINKVDFDEKVHELVGETAAPKAKKNK